MEIGVVGSRYFTNIGLLYEELGKRSPTKIISGGAKGADSIAEGYARDHNIELLVFLPDYTKFGKVAPLIRNKDIVKNSKMILAFWDGKSRGTKFTIDFAKESGVPVEIIKF